MILKLNGQRMYEITSDFLENEKFRSHPHLGVDLAMPIGTPLYSPISGHVQRVCDYGHQNIGKGVIVETDDHQTLILGHLSHVNVREGAVLQLGDKIGLSGNTGNVIGNGHLHIGLKDAHGHFINPSKVEQSFQEVAKEMHSSGGHEHLGILGLAVKDSNPITDTNDFMGYIHDLKTQGFFMATFDKTPAEFCFGWIGDALRHGLHFILENDEAFLILPSLFFLFGTFLVGRHKYTKWIMPLWLAYFASAILTETTGLMEWLDK